MINPQHLTIGSFVLIENKIHKIVGVNKYVGAYSWEKKSYFTVRTNMSHRNSFPLKDVSPIPLQEPFLSIFDIETNVDDYGTCYHNNEEFFTIKENKFVHCAQLWFLAMGAEFIEPVEKIIKYNSKFHKFYERQYEK